MKNIIIDHVCAELMTNKNIALGPIGLQLKPNALLSALKKNSKNTYNFVWASKGRPTIFNSIKIAIFWHIFPPIASAKQNVKRPIINFIDGRHSATATAK